jgi:hypothetical protein
VLGTAAVVKGPTVQVQAGKQTRSYSEGNSTKARIKDVDMLKLQVFLELV